MTSPLPAPTRRWLWRSLWGWAMAAMVALWVLLAVFAYATGRHEAREITDGHLESTARLFLERLDLDRLAVRATPEPTVPPSPRQAEYAPTVHLILWRDRAVVADTGGLAGPWATDLPAGLRTLDIPFEGRVQAWRLYATETVLRNGESRRVVALVDADSHHGLALDIAEHTLRPALLLLPVLAVLLAWAIRRGLRPVRQLSDTIDRLDVRQAEQRLPAQPYRELNSAVHAINQLLDRLQALWLRERRFASDVAHELRTPLTALVFRARAARSLGGETDRAEALAELERDALRAAAVLQNLLDFARAERRLPDPASRVDLVALAREAVARSVPLAHEQGRELDLQADAADLLVPGHPELLQMALRNLLDNALRHTPDGTPVRVRVACSDDGAMTLAVCDRADPNAARVQNSDGLGLGLGLVQRVADAHGAEFVRADRDADGWHCFALRWRPAQRG